jgi:hypothetical protein
VDISPLPHRNVGCRTLKKTTMHYYWFRRSLVSLEAAEPQLKLSRARASNSVSTAALGELGPQLALQMDNIGIVGDSVFGRQVARRCDRLPVDRLGFARDPHRVPLTPEKIKQVVDKTLNEKPPNATHWSVRSMAAVAGISYSSVQRIWCAHGLKPHLVETFKVSAKFWSRVAELKTAISGSAPNAQQ